MNLLQSDEGYGQGSFLPRHRQSPADHFLAGPRGRAGISGVEIFCAKQHLDYRNKSQVAELGHWFRDSELKLHSLHSPMYTDEIWGRSGPTPTSTSPTKKGDRIKWVDEIKRAIEIAEVFRSAI
jgi:hypothetical protein